MIHRIANRAWTTHRHARFAVDEYASRIPRLPGPAIRRGKVDEQHFGLTIRHEQRLIVEERKSVRSRELRRANEFDCGDRHLPGVGLLEVSDGERIRTEPGEPRSGARPATRQRPRSDRSR